MRYGVGEDASEARLSRELEPVVESSVAAHCKTGSVGDAGCLPERRNRQQHGRGDDDARQPGR